MRVTTARKLSCRSLWVLGCAQRRSLTDRRRSAQDILMGRKARPCIRLEHPIGKRILLRHGEILFDFIARHERVAAESLRGTLGSLIAMRGIEVKAVELAFGVLDQEGAMPVRHVVRRRQ